MSKITSIKEVFDDEGYDGYIVTTEEDTYFVGISCEDHWCESFGCVTSEDDIEDFIGSDLLSVEVVDKNYNLTEVDFGRGDDDYEAVFINFNTTNGLLQIVAYNIHNGYYGHDAVYIKNDKIEASD